jgi:hypothetical protein
LAEFWNETLGEVKYDPDAIKDRLRKGHPSSRGMGAAQRSLEFWRAVYGGDLRASFPGPFPLSRELEELFQQQAAKRERARQGTGGSPGSGKPKL